jgi:hypothetical protein
VLAKDAATGEQQWKQVTHLFETPEKEMLEVGLEGEGGTTETIETTPGHPFWVQEQGWTHAVDLKRGDIVSTADGSWLRVTSTTLTRRGTVYNFTVADFHTYFVGQLGAWVHNTSPCPNAPKSAALPNIPKNAKMRVLKPDPKGGAQYGVEYKWTNADGQTVRFRAHGPDATAPAGSNAASGPTYRLQVGNRYMDAQGNLHPRNVHNPNSPHYNPDAANATHIPFVWE